MLMIPSDLKQKLKEHGDIDADALYPQYRDEGATSEPGGTEDVNDFIRYLRDRGLIDARTLAELHAVQSPANPLEATFILAADDPRQASSAAGPEAAAPEAAAPVAAAPVAAAPAAAAPVAAGSEEDEPPRYDILDVLGKGAMGEVHIAKDVVLRRLVAFKSILPAMSQNQQVVDRFLGEMQITSQLDHPFIVPVYGLEVTPEGSIAYAMKLVKGKELADLLAESKRMIAAGERLDEEHSLSGRIEAFLKVCDAIAFAHEKKIVHRDLKPANIMLGEHKEVYVMDWGIARPMGAAGNAADAGLELYDGAPDGEDTQRTRLGQALGTPLYMSPEQAAGKNEELDGRSDLYTLGLILQEVMTLERAVGGTTLAEVLTNAKLGKREAPRPIEQTALGSRELEAIIAKATRLEPKDRYATVDDFAHDIRRYLRNEEVSVLPDNGVRKFGRWISKHRMASLSIMLTFLLIGAGAAIGLLAYNRAQAAEQHTRELRLSELQTESALHAHSIDQKLSRYESGLAQLVGAAQLELSHPTRHGRRAYLASDFSGGTSPTDLLPSKYYKKAISATSAVFLVADGTQPDGVAPLLSSLPVLEPTLGQVMLDSATEPGQKISPAQRTALIAERGLPVHNVFVSLADGVSMSFPGMAGLAGDPRDEPAYKSVAEAKGLSWGKPHQSATLGGMVMTCSAPLYDEEARFRGVAGIEVSIDRLGEDINLGLSYVSWAALVARDGTMMTSTGIASVGTQLAEVLALPAVAAAMKAGTGGHAAASVDGQPVLVTYYPLHSVEWYFVTVASVTNMLDSEPQKEPTTPWAGAVPSALPVVPVAPPPKPVVEPPDAGAGGEDAGVEDAGAGGSAPEPPQPPPPTGVWPSPKSSTTPPAPPSPSPSPGAPPPIPKNPFDKWDAYKKDKGKTP